MYAIPNLEIVFMKKTHTHTHTHTHTKRLSDFNGMSTCLGFFLCQKVKESHSMYVYINIFCTQLYDKCSYLMQIICTQLYSFK